MKTRTKIFAIGLLSASIASVQAAPIINVSTEGLSGPDDADEAQSAFLGSLVSSSTENFDSETAAVDYNDQSLTFSSTKVGDFSVKAGDVGTGGACNDNGFKCDKGLAVLNDTTTPFSGRFDVSEFNWLDSMDARVMRFDPNPGNNALGFFMTDPNDAGGSFDINGKGFDFEDVFGQSLGNGKVFYIDLYDPDGLDYIEIASNNPNDGYGIDDVTIGRVPEPGTLALLGLGLFGLGASYRRRS